MKDNEAEARAFLLEFQDQPEDIRRIFIYVICQTMVQAGMLEFLGAFNTSGIGVTLVYKNPDAGEIFEIIKPDMTQEEEQAVRIHIEELLQENAQAA